MLQEVLVSPTAKLDISLLLKASSSPSPPPPGTAAPPSISRSLSVPSTESRPPVTVSPSTSGTSQFSTSTAPAFSHQRSRTAGFSEALPAEGAATPGPNSKRPAPSNPHPSSSPAKKGSKKWTEAEDKKVRQLRAQGKKWDDIAAQIPNRSSISCRLHYQNYLEKRPIWTEEKKKRLAMLYERHKEQWWSEIAQDLDIPWRAVEEMHWELGQEAVSRLGGGRMLNIDRSARASQSTAATGPNITTSSSVFVGTPLSAYSTPGALGTPTTNGLGPPLARLASGMGDSGRISGLGSLQKGRRSEGGNRLHLPSLAEMTAGIPAHSPYQAIKEEDDDDDDHEDDYYEDEVHEEEEE